MNTLTPYWRPLLMIGLAALLAYIVIVPICGWLFNCGCDWPWRGFTRHCNVHIAEEMEKCPWCVNSFLGTILFRIPSQQ